MNTATSMTQVEEVTDVQSQRSGRKRRMNTAKEDDVGTHSRIGI